MRCLAVLLLSTATVTGQGFHARSAAIAKALPAEISQALDEAARHHLKTYEALKKQGLSPTRPKPIQKPRRFHVLAERPFAVCVEVYDGIEAELVAVQRMGRLQELARAFRTQTKCISPVDIDRPLTIVLLREEAAHRAYLQAMTGFRASSLVSHAEMDKRRVVAHVGSRDRTLFHETTHLLLQAYRRSPGAHHALPLWFEEGFADWMGRGRRTLKAGKESWEFGLLHKDHVAFLARTEAEGRLLSIRELIDATVATRDGWLASNSRRLWIAYAQGWALVHLLKHYDVDDGGHVVFGADGKLGRGRYADGWDRWVAYQVHGKDGRPWSGRAAFQEAFGLDDAGLDRLATECRAWIRWLTRKINLEQIKHGRVIAWHRAVLRDRRVGVKDDDLLRR